MDQTNNEFVHNLSRCLSHHPYKSMRDHILASFSVAASLDYEPQLQVQRPEHNTLRKQADRCALVCNNHGG